MRTLLALLLSLSLVSLAACGGDEAPSTTPRPLPPGTDRPSAPPPGEPQARPGAGRTPRADSDGRATGGIGPVGKPYLCQGQAVRRLSADGPVRVSPAVVRPGDAFTVTVTDRDAEEAAVSLAGASSQPVFVVAARSGGRLTAELRMPRGASCGNKLLSVEGDVSAEAYVAVRP